MTDTRKSTPKPKPKLKPRKVSPPTSMTQMPGPHSGILLEAETLAELRDHWHWGRLEPDDLRAVGEAIYGKDWRKEIAKDLVLFRPDGKGGKRSGDALSHAIIGRWLDPGKPDEIPPWVAPALLELPRVALERRRRAAAKELAAFEARLDDVQKRWIHERVPRFTAAPPTIEPPASDKSFSLDEFMSLKPPSTEEKEAAYDAGWHDYGVTAGESDDDLLGMLDAPLLKMEWDRGWREGNEDHRRRHAEWVRQHGD